MNCDKSVPIRKTEVGYEKQRGESVILNILTFQLPEMLYLIKI